MSLETPPSGAPSPSEIAATTRRRPSLWRHGNFMKLWSAQTISQFGDEVTQLALPLVAILTLEATPFEIGLLGTFQFLPFILLTIPAGVWVDRMRRKPILIAADIGRAVLLTSIPVAFIGGWLSIPQLYAVAFTVGCLEVFFDVAYQSYLPAVVERDQLVEGNSKLELSVSASSVIGPGVAGFLVELFRAPFAIVFDVLSYVGSAIMLLLIRRPETPPAPHDVA
ncbi:MAG: MFS transporter, partial [Candidatus Limnocylindria bacterium]